MPEPTSASRLLWAIVGVAAIVGVGAAVWINLKSDNSAPPDTSKSAPTTPSRPPVIESTPRDYPPPRYTESKFTNVGADAKFVGTGACIECHSGHHDSFLLTHHSRALADLDPKAEPPDASFFHKPSGRWYRVYRKDGQLRHEEIIKAADGKEVSRVDLPIRYLIGSGNFCRSYLVEVDGFLHESPITWYTAKKKWDMSPGYDFPQHFGFERRVNLACLNCHSGRVEPKDDTVHKHHIREQAIGCESCHGPGSKHVELRRAKKLIEADMSIVNPAKLSRPLLESVCANCHLSGQAAVTLRGRKVNDYRPGRPLTDYRVDYKFDTGSEQMTVVGHIEQLRRSSCYQKSGMTCLTCHDPHARSRPADTVAFFKQKCLDCHGNKGCSLPRAERLKKDAADNCVTCHMPRTDTDIPHLTFTHHRIGKHGGAAPGPPDRVPELVPIDDVSHLPEIDRKRNLGLAYLDVADKPEHKLFAPTFRQRAHELLKGVYMDGLRDGAGLEALAETFDPLKDRNAGRFATEAILSREIAPNQKALAGAILANAYIGAGDVKSAVTALETVVRLRRHSDDWLLLGQCHLELKQPQKALDALKQAEAIRPDRPDVHKSLADAYQLLGNTDKAREHIDKGNRLIELLPK